MKSFLCGIGLGIGLGILFAPMSGEETRNNLTDKAGDLADTARQTYKQGRDRARRSVESIRGTAERTVDQARSTADDFVEATGTLNS